MDVQTKKNDFWGLSKTAHVMCVSLVCLFVLVWTGGILLIVFVYPFEGLLQFSAGLLAGSLLSLAKVILLEKALVKAVDLEDARAKNYANFQAMLRYIGTAAVLSFAFFFNEIFGVIGIICGVLSLQIAAYLTTAVLKRNPAYVDEPAAAAVREAEARRAEEEEAGLLAGEVSAALETSQTPHRSLSFWEEEIDGADPDEEK